MNLIDKDALVAEIERRLHFDNNWIEGDKRMQIHTKGVSSVYYKMIGSKHACESILDFINDLKVKEVDLQKEIDKEWEKCNPIDEGMGVESAYIHIEAFDMIARHFFELGLKAKQG